MNNIELSADIARELHSLGLPLVAESPESSYTVTDINKALSAGHIIKYPNERLVIEIDKMRKQSDWSGFKDYLKQQIGSNMDKLTPYILGDMQLRYQKEKSLSMLSDKIASEYEQFIFDLKKRDPDEIIKAAYEIFNKENIVDFSNNNELHLERMDIEILLETDNVLDEIYQEWDKLPNNLKQDKHSRR